MRQWWWSMRQGNLCACWIQRATAFTLLEVMVAIVVFSIALLGLGSMHITAMRLNAAAQRRAQLATVAQEQVEDLLRQRYTAAVFADPDSAIGQGHATTYCVLYPPEGLKPCQADTPPPAPGPRPYCRIVQQAPGGTECSEASFPPPAVGYKMQWSVDKHPLDTVAYVDLIASQRSVGRRQAKTFTLSFVKSSI